MSAAQTHDLDWRSIFLVGTEILLQQEFKPDFVAMSGGSLRWKARHPSSAAAPSGGYEEVRLTPGPKDGRLYVNYVGRSNEQIEMDANAFTDLCERLAKPLYQAVLNEGWDFGHMFGAIEEELTKLSDAKAYIWGQTEGLTDPVTFQVVTVPIFGVYITSRDPPNQINIAMRENDVDKNDNLDMKERQCRWTPVQFYTPSPLAGRIFYLDYEHKKCTFSQASQNAIPAGPLQGFYFVSDAPKHQLNHFEELDQIELAKFVYANMYIAPEVLEPSKSAWNDENCVRTAIYSLGTRALSVEIDVRELRTEDRKDIDTEKVAEEATNFCEDNDVDKEEASNVAATITDVARDALKVTLEELGRRRSMTAEEKAQCSNARRLKIVPQGGPIDVTPAKFINRFFLQAHRVVPEPKQQSGFGFGSSSFFKQDDEVAPMDATTPTTPVATIVTTDVVYTVTETDGNSVIVHGVLAHEQHKRVREEGQEAGQAEPENDGQPPAKRARH